MRIATTIPRTPVLNLVLAADAAVELAVGIALLAWRGEAQTWFGFRPAVTVTLASAFIAAALVPAGLALFDAKHSSVPALAWANTIGGAAGWLALPFLWSALEPEARWIAAATFDTFITLGVAELLILRSLRRGTAEAQ